MILRVIEPSGIEDIGPLALKGATRQLRKSRAPGVDCTTESMERGSGPRGRGAKVKRPIGFLLRNIRPRGAGGGASGFFCLRGLVFRIGIVRF